MSLYNTHMEFVDHMRIVVSKKEKSIYESAMVENFRKLMSESYNDSEIAFAKLYTKAESLEFPSQLSESKAEVKKVLPKAALISTLVFAKQDGVEKQLKQLEAKNDFTTPVNEYPGGNFYATAKVIISKVNFVSDAVEAISDVFAFELKQRDVKTKGYISKNIDPLLYAIGGVAYAKMNFQIDGKLEKLIDLTKKKFVSK